MGKVASGGPAQPRIIRSWARSQEAGLDPGAPPRFHRISADALQRRLADHRDLVAVATPHLRWLSEWFKDRPHVAYLVDADGVILHAEGDPSAIDRWHLTPGHDWSETVMGTNGAGTALASGSPVAVVGCDHWLTAWKDATCLGAPILDRAGRPVAAIDVSMDARGEGDRERLGIVAHVAYTIAQALASPELEAALDRAQAAEGALRRSEQHLHAILDSTPALVYVVDTAGTFRLINRRFAEQFGIESERVIGASLSQCFPVDVAEQFAANNRRVLESREVCEFEEVVPRDDQVCTYLSVKAPLFDGDGVAYGVCGVSTDITERKRLMSALEQAHRQKDTSIATVAHELRQPLGAIQTALVVMQARISREKGERARGVVERQTRQLARMVDDLLDAARLAQGKVVLQRERTRLRPILEAGLGIVQPLVRERHQHLTVRIPDEPLWLDADAARLQQVFSNLLTNASKFTGSGGRISLTVEREEGAVRVLVRDTGRGIATEMLPQIFELFSQIQPDGRGLGIGLALVRRLVERHGGTVEAQSDGPDRGSTFIVSLPLATGPDDAREASPSGGLVTGRAPAGDQP